MIRNFIKKLIERKKRNEQFKKDFLKTGIDLNESFKILEELVDNKF